MTEITAINKRGNVVYHYFTPRALTQEEIEKDLKDWGVSPEQHKIKIKIEKIWSAKF